MKKELVTEIISVELIDEKTLIITASAQVPTPGWTEPELAPYIYIQPPRDGIYDFDFIALPPSGPVPQVLSHIEVKHVVDPVPSDLLGVRVHGRTNSVEARRERAVER